MITAQRIADLVGGILKGDVGRPLDRLSTIEQSTSNSVTFISDKKYLSKLSSCQAGLLLTKDEFTEGYQGDYIVVTDPYLAFAQVSHLFDPEPRVANSIHESAVIHETAKLGIDVTIGANAVIGENVTIADGSSVGANSTIGEGCQVGSNTIIYAGVTLYHQIVVGNTCQIHSGTVIGSHGFGYANHNGEWHKIAQIGRVVIGDSVEIGANCAIDRGAIEDTYIESGTKLDNLVHIAHNVKIGEHSAIAGQVGISGSTEIGHHTMVGGQAGFVGHIKTAPGSVFTGQAMVSGSVPNKGVYSSGTGYFPSSDWRKMAVRLRHLDEMSKKIKTLEKQIDALSNPDADSSC